MQTKDNHKNIENIRNMVNFSEKTQNRQQFSKTKTKIKILQILPLVQTGDKEQY